MGRDARGDFSQAVATSATLTFHGIRNNDWSSNKLYIHLLDSAPERITRYTDNQGGGDSISGQGIELVAYTNLPPIAQDLVYTFDENKLGVLTEYLRHGGNVAPGVDPDCHFYNCGITWALEYANPVPEPALMGLMSVGGALLLRKRSRRG